MTTAADGAQYPFFNISGAAQQIFTRSGQLVGVSINTIGTVVLCYDSPTTSGVGASNLLVTLNAATLGFQSIELSFQTGLVIATTGGAVCSGAYA